jgi:hypothetical protein
MKIQIFEGIIAWQRVKYLGVSIHTEFSGNRDFRFKDQIQRLEKLSYSPPFYSPSLIELERGNNWKRSTHIAPLFFKKRGVGGELREGCGGRRRAK